MEDNEESVAQQAAQQSSQEPNKVITRSGSSTTHGTSSSKTDGTSSSNTNSSGESHTTGSADVPKAINEYNDIMDALGGNGDDVPAQQYATLAGQLLPLRKKQALLPEQLEAQERARAARANIYALGEMMRLFSEMATTVRGGNVYKEQNMLPALMKDSDNRIARILKDAQGNEANINKIVEKIGKLKQDGFNDKLLVALINANKSSDKTYEGNKVTAGERHSTTTGEQDKRTTSGSRTTVVGDGSSGGSGSGNQIVSFTPSSKSADNGKGVRVYNLTKNQFNTVARAAVSDLLSVKDGQTVLKGEWARLVVRLSGNMSKDDIIGALIGFQKTGILDYSNTEKNNFYRLMQQVALYTPRGRSSYEQLTGKRVDVDDLNWYKDNNQQ